MSALFMPMSIHDCTFRNRVAMPPMVMGSGDTDGRVTEDTLAHYGARADAGTGLIIVEATAVAAGGRCWPRGLNAYADEHKPGLARLAARVLAAGAVASVQLVHGGPQGSAEMTGGTVGPSAVAPSAGKPVPRALTVAEILAIEDQFAEAAARAVAAGFDMVEIHGAHGFLLDSFLSPRRNQREDDYGGTLAGRLRMLLETCRRVRACIGPTPLLCCRISLFNHLAEGFSADDLGQLVNGLEQTGLDLLHVSTDGAFKEYFDTDKTLGQWVKEYTTLPIIVAGGLGHPIDAERAVAEGHADFAAVGHAQLDNPAWTREARELLVKKEVQLLQMDAD